MAPAGPPPVIDSSGENGLTMLHVHMFQRRIVTARAPPSSPQTPSSRGPSRFLQEVEDLCRKDTPRRASLSRAQEGRNKSLSALRDNVRIYHAPMLALPCLPRIKHRTIPFVYHSALDLITYQKLEMCLPHTAATDSVRAQCR